MRRAVKLVALGTLAVASLGVTASAALAANPPKGPVSRPPAAGKVQAEHATLYLSVLVSALQSKQVGQPVKAALMGCIYNNSLGKITDSMDKVIGQNAGKIHRNNPSELLGVMVRICGFVPPAGGGAKAPAGR